MENRFSNHYGQHRGEIRDYEFDGVVNTIGLRLANNGVRRAEGVHGAFDIRDVLLGPCDLDLDPI